MTQRHRILILGNAALSSAIADRMQDLGHAVIAIDAFTPSDLDAAARIEIQLESIKDEVVRELTVQPAPWERANLRIRSFDGLPPEPLFREPGKKVAQWKTERRNRK